MDAATLEITLHRQMLCLPESIVFQTAFSFNDVDTFKRMYDKAHTSLIVFLQMHHITFTGPEMHQMDNGNITYYFPSYKVLLDKASAKKMAAYQRTHPELGGVMIKAHFSETDQLALFGEINAQATAEALIIAEKQQVALMPDPEITQIQAQKHWEVFPLLSTEVDFSRQVLERGYMFVFKTTTNQ